MERRQRKDPSKNLVECVIGEVRYAIPIAVVREIVNPLPLVELPSAPAAVIGVADYRDEVVPVLDLRARFGLEAAPLTRRTKWVVVDRGSHLLALVVDGVTEVFRSGEIRDAPPIGPGDDVRGIDGVTTHEGEMVFVLDAARFDDVVAPLARAALAQGART